MILSRVWSAKYVVKECTRLEAPNPFEPGPVVPLVFKTTHARGCELLCVCQNVNGVESNADRDSPVLATRGKNFEPVFKRGKIKR
jgi:hypothetical protein